MSEIKDHLYAPDYQAMGDCRVCGHDCNKPWHLNTPAWEAKQPQVDHLSYDFHPGERD